MGLGFNKANAQGVPTIMDQLKNQQLISRKLIGVNLVRASDGIDDGEISFGVVDTGKFSGKLAIVPNVAQSGLWEVPIDDITVGGTSLGLTGRTSITDTGTSNSCVRSI
jgi:Eukaryotic aspartyl protease